MKNQWPFPANLTASTGNLIGDSKIPQPKITNMGCAPWTFGPIDQAEAILTPDQVEKLRKDTGALESDPSGKNPHAPGAKLDAGKVRPWLFYSGFARALNEVARVTTKGAEKYTPNGWAQVDNGVERYMEAFGRHMVELGKGEVFDNGPKGLGPDIYHKAQMIWNLLASLELELREQAGWVTKNAA